MTTPTDRTEPLDPHERELARIVRALPGGDPPAALDARILKAAADAVARPSPRRRLLFAGGSTGALWGIGSAAAAILAVGIGYKMTVPPDSSLPVPRVLPTAVDAPEHDSTPVEFVPMPERTYENEGPPAAAVIAPADAPKLQARPSAPQAPPPPAPMTSSAPEPSPEAPSLRYNDRAEELAAPTQDADLGFAEAQGKAADSAAMESSATAAAPAPGAATNAGRDAREDYTLRHKEEAAAAALGGLTEQRAQTAETGLRQRVLVDRELAPDAWLERVRMRLSAGDRPGARASLLLFVERHPGHTIPDDLRPLLAE
jgi:hypothetical protein